LPIFEFISEEEGIFEEFVKNIEASYLRILAKENKLSEEETAKFMLKSKYMTVEGLKVLNKK